jgi:FLYWCH zinc finger domain
MAQGAYIVYPFLTQPERSMFSTTQRGKPMLRDSFNYEYTLYREVKNRKFWTCMRERSKLHPPCPGRATTVGDFTVSTRQHNHLSDPTLVKVRDEEKKGSLQWPGSILHSRPLTCSRSGPRLPSPQLTEARQC